MRTVPPSDARAGGAAAPPDIAITVAVPDRPSDVRLTLAIPSFVFPCASIWPRLVKNCTTVPSATGTPVVLMTMAEMSDTPPVDGIRQGLATRVMLEPGGASDSAGLQRM